MKTLKAASRQVDRMIPENVSSLDAVVFIFRAGIYTTVHLTAIADVPPKGVDVLYATAVRMAEQMGAAVQGFVAWDVDGNSMNVFHPGLKGKDRKLVEAMLDKLANGRETSVA